MTQDEFLNLACEDAETALHNHRQFRTRDNAFAAVEAIGIVMRNNLLHRVSPDVQHVAMSLVR